MKNIFLWFGIAFLSFSAAAWTAWLSDQATYSRWVGSLLGPLNISVKTEDDLMALDWARRLEAQEGVEAFRAESDGKPIATGGLQPLLSGKGGSGFEFMPPRRYRVRIEQENGGVKKLHLEIILKAFPGPLLWGFLGAFLGLIGAGFQHWADHEKNREKPGHAVPKGKNVASSDPAEEETQTLSSSGTLHRSTLSGMTPLQYPEVISSSTESAHEPSVSLPETASNGETDPPSIQLDARWTIQTASPKAVSLFQRSLSDLVGLHLLDLEPHPSLLEILEKGGKSVAGSGFNRFPHLQVQITPLGNGGVRLTLHEARGSE